MSEFKNAIEKYAKYVIQQSRSNLTKAKKGGGNLYNSLDYDLKQNRSSKGKFESGYNVEFFMEDYGIYQDLGVKGIGGSTKKGKAYENKGRFITNQSLSFAIAKSVFHTGIKRSLFFTKPFEAGITKYDNDIANAYGDDILRQL